VLLGYRAAAIPLQTACVLELGRQSLNLISRLGECLALLLLKPLGCGEPVYEIGAEVVTREQPQVIGEFYAVHCF
jgi:hypothetical protein